MAGYMPQDLFEFGAVTIAKIHVSGGRSIEDLAMKLSEDYKYDYLEDGLLGDWVEAARSVVHMIRTYSPKTTVLCSRPASSFSIVLKRIDRTHIDDDERSLEEHCLTR
jgi:hypothetical protein